jgi:Flp pilus assembly protein protease CpaA
LIWRIHIIGGGDAKFLMGLFALFPTQQFVLLFGLIVLAVSIPLMILKHWSSDPLQILQSIAGTLRSGDPLPTQEDLESQGRRYAWTFCLPGIVYTWWFW